MAKIKKKDLTELVGGDVFAGGNDRNVVSNSEIETGPVQKPVDDDSDYQKGLPTTTDKVFGQYRQNIPWFAVYSWGGYSGGRGIAEEGSSKPETTIVKKKNVEEKIEDLVKKNRNTDLTDKNYNPKVARLIDAIGDVDLTDAQLEELSQAIADKKNNPNKTKNI